MEWQTRRYGLSDEVIHRVYDCPEGADVEFDIDVDATRDGWAFMSQFTNDGGG